MRDRMVHEVLALAGDTSLDAAARLFTFNGISGAPVIDDAGKALGVVTQRDLIDADKPRSRAKGRSFYYRVSNGEIRATGIVLAEPAPVRGVASDVMSTPILTIEGEDALALAARIMVRHHVHRLFVMDQGRIIGLISSLDCLRALVGEGS